MKRLISVVVPLYNEESVLEAFYTRATSVMERHVEYDWELLFVDDGSKDRSSAIVHRLRQADPRVGTIVLSRNFGKEIAMTAGLDHARGDAVVMIDVDLQDPPELIGALLAQWENGYDVVYAQRTHRDGEGWLKRTTASLFYRLMARLSNVDIPRDTGDFRLMSRRAVDALLTLRERHRFLKGLFAWIGFPSVAVPYRRAPRHAGRSKFNYWKLWNFALEGFTSFTTAPLRFATYLGLTIGLLAFVFGFWVIAKTMIWGDPVPGYPSLMAAISFLGGVQLFCIGVLGEYLARVLGESKGRPLYIVQEHQPAKGPRALHGSSPAQASSDT
jgi:polyisoprenyl-phosphate glycosyltransferase